MSKLIAESLYEFRAERENAQELNEAIQPGKTFRQLFLQAAHALVKAGQVEKVKGLLKWAKKLQELGWPREIALKKALGDQGYKSFIKGVLPFMQKQVPSFSATPGGTTASQKGGDVGKDDATRLQVVADALGIAQDELKSAITK